MTARRYTRTAVVLHWLVAVLIVANVALALSVDALPEDWERPVVDLHKSLGITVLGLFVLRLLWRLGHPPPALPPTYSRWERRLAPAAHGALYALLLLLPLSGWLHDSAWRDAATHPMTLFGLVPWPRIAAIQSLDPALRESLHGLFGTFHEYFADGLYVLLGLHVAGALKHQFLDREDELQRMWW